ncbi:MAG: tetratricopeptide repeat protein [Candidatus Omnitrophica bacterium]|nr:tetratricopeptide repeat protein [Candidatus Omnitrophota bacterium]
MRRYLWTVGSWVVVSAMAGSVAGAEAGTSSAPTAPASVAQTGQPQYDFGNLTSETLTRKAWDALKGGDHAAVEAYTKKCIQLYEAKAVQQASGLTAFAPKDQAAGYWALNDVATCYLIHGQSLSAQGKASEADAALKTVIERFPYAQAWDPQGWYWKVAQAAQDRLDTAGTGVDFGDYKSSTLTTNAWEALTQGDHRAVELYAKKCIELYHAQATQQQAELKAFASAEDAPKLWALNDVGTAYFIRGQSLLAQGKIQDAQQAFQGVIEQFPFAQAWDPQGWFWRVADAASDKLSTIGTPYDFGDYKSETLVKKAWGALDKSDHRGVELYVKKCIELYEADAKRQQASLSGFPPKEKVFEHWALNDVATCYFVLGESLIAQKRYQEARAAFERVINDFGYAQCWDARGWFWKVAVGARDRLNKILALSGS